MGWMDGAILKKADDIASVVDITDGGGSGGGGPWGGTVQ